MRWVVGRAERTAGQMVSSLVVLLAVRRVVRMVLKTVDLKASKSVYNLEI